eukprot:TRINITY_DN75733_c0_g1_i1.p1 TRINITY_DN75733_c0_g1~~TRINITY_DN75733_c0_g1_i1.p1  ORF type:complete len:442 (+),score=46.96 TRINITY_DN75733_c0_g1_i1:98-1423(+)
MAIALGIELGTVEALVEGTQGVLTEKECNLHNNTAAETTSTPVLSSTAREGLGPAGIVIAIFKANCGCGILFMPRAWGYGGGMLSAALLLFLGVTAIFCALRLLDCRKLHPSRSYGEIMELAVGARGSKALEASIVMFQCGVCCMFLIGVATLFRNALLSHTTPMRWLLLGEVAVLIPFILIRKVSSLWFANLLGTVLVMSGIATVLFCEVMRVHDDNVDWGAVPLYNPRHCLVFMGTAGFCFEGVSTFLPIYDSSAEPHRFSFLYCLTISVIMVLVGTVGLLGFVAYGDSVESLVLLNLKNANIRLYTQVAFAVAMLATFPLQFLPALDIFEAKVFRNDNLRPSSGTKLQENIVRIIILVCIGLVSFLGSTSVDHFLSIIGALCGIPLNFVFPLICHSALVGGDRFTIWVNRMLALVGAILTVAITILNVTLWVCGKSCV